VILYGNSDHLTHFTGFMLEEEIVTSFWEFVLITRNAQNGYRLTVQSEDYSLFLSSQTWEIKI
jgi:hypothetical protein